ncbi:MAG: helix-turn-helix domain-containing protein [Dehalococcoidales bacterium]|nr:helix-turn-helix domain-containing protein [Dehalococcoidales bacterium]
MTNAPHSDSIAIMGKQSRDTDGQYELEQAAQELGIGIATLYRWMRKGIILPIRIYRRTFIPKSEVERLKKKATAAKP